MYWWERKFEEWWQRPGKNDTTDFQRHKVYASESAAFAPFMEALPAFESIQDIQKYVDRLVKYGWFKRRFGDCCIEVRARRARTRGCGNCYNRSTHEKRYGYIKIPSDRTNLWVVLHEVVHAVLPSVAGSGHGRLFAKAAMEVYRLALPKEIARAHHELLKEQYKKNNVKHNPRRQLSLETRQQLRDNFVKHALSKEAAMGQL